MSGPTIVVAGLGRCGSSLTMQMLHAGGIPCVGDWPSFEDPRAGVMTDRPWIRGLSSVAVKRLDIFHDPTMPPNFITIWLDREPKEQAKSMLKLLGSVFADVPNDRRTRKAMAASIEPDTRKSLAILKGPPLLQLSFEQTVLWPRSTLSLIKEFIFVNGGYQIDTEKAAAVVRDRSEKCLPGMLEFEMLEQRSAR